MRPRKSLTAAALGVMLPPLAAHADPAGVEAATRFSIERSYTSNALDRADPLPDWLNTLRGGVAVVVPHEGGRLRVGVEAEQTTHDSYAFEDDSSLRLSLSGEHAATDRLTFGADLTAATMSEGDDLEIDDLVLGIRTRTLSAAAALKAAYRLTEALTLAGELSASRSDPRPAEFEAALVEPQQLSPRRDVLGAGLRLAHVSGATTYAVAGGAELRQVGVAGMPPYDFRLGRQFLRAEVAGKVGDLALSVSAGAERLAGMAGALDIVRPALAGSVAYAFAGGATLRGSVSAGLVLDSGDDPVGSWLREVAVEGSLPVGGRLTLSAGLSLSRRENLLLGYEEDARGAFAGARIALGHGLSLGAELGVSSRRPLPDGAPVESLDAGVSLSFALPAPRPAARSSM